MTRSFCLLVIESIFAGFCLATAIPSAFAQAPDGWGTIKGQIVFGGEKIPDRKLQNVTMDKEHCLSKGPLLDEEWIINPKNKGLRWTFVWLGRGDDPKGKLPIHPKLNTIGVKQVEIDQPCCQFVPHALAIRQGQELVAKNSAPVAHNVNWTGGVKNPGGNQILPAGKSYTITNLVADRFPVKIACNIHPWMNGWVRVFDHPYFALTDADGNFEIKDAPAGNYRLFIWHETGYRGGSKGREGEGVTIKKDAVTDLGKLEFKP
jgi:plastocyanin